MALSVSAVFVPVLVNPAVTNVSCRPNQKGSGGTLALACFLARCFKKLMGKGVGCIGESCCKCVHMHAGEGLFKTLWRKMGRKAMGV